MTQAPKQRQILGRLSANLACRITAWLPFFRLLLQVARRCCATRRIQLVMSLAQLLRFKEGGKSRMAGVGM
jgi:hypothetical protein